MFAKFNSEDKTIETVHEYKRKTQFKIRHKIISNK